MSWLKALRLRRSFRVCRRCGSVVADWALHVDWHYDLDPERPLNSEDFRG